jgi:glyoxylase-like metal-dependent hydrolase (beta-lactamase superfamily II)
MAPRVIRLGNNLLAFYDGRLPGADQNAADDWVQDGALSLGIASYAIVDAGEALVYDTHVSVEHGAFIRRTVEELGATRITVVLSHWHLDHVAGTEAFAGCDVVAGALTARLLAEHREAIESGTHEGPPAINPLVLPTRVLDGPAELQVGGTRVELLPFAIHSADATVLRLPRERLLLAGDTLEDTVTYVSEPEHLKTHLDELSRMRRLDVDRLLPNHGSPEVIGRGGYEPTLIDATQRYLRDLLRHAREPKPGDDDLRVFVADQLAAGWLVYFAPYERVHRSNLEAVTA